MELRAINNDEVFTVGGILFDKVCHDGGESPALR